ncbi:Glu/Leu/Phe/Val dehydrogenase [Candidatus Saccharibacteria bacterium]|nr:Glu/Leu/Phe/Val dehydrogenase [Candidatus Saccharibacteria bacterium]
MHTTVTYFLQESAKRLGLSDQQLNKLLTPNKVHEFTITLNNGKCFQAYRSQHNNDRGPYKGGIRFHPDVTRSEVVALSILMSLKTALLDLPLGGGKGGIAVDPKQLTTHELEELSRKYVAYLSPYIGPQQDIPAPDVQTNSQIIDWMTDEYHKITGDTSGASFTGKSLKKGGSNGREAATGRGGFIVAQTIMQSNNITDVSYGLQGLGNVGSFFATEASTLQPRWQLQAASDSKTAISSKDIDAKSLVAYKKHNQKIAGFPNTEEISGSQLIRGEYTMLVLAALGNVITPANASVVRARFIIELANGPVTDKATDILFQQGTEVVPDILANAGGVVVSYYEWLQNMQKKRWTHEDVNTKLDATMTQATVDVLDYAKLTKTTLKQAAFDVAVCKLLDLPLRK